MNLREEIKKVFADEENAEACGEIALLKKYAVNAFTRKILNDARRIAKRNDISGTFKFGALAPSYNSKTSIKGKAKRKLFTKLTVWKFSIDVDSPEMIRYDAIKQYAEEENITIDLELSYTKQKNREFEFDLSKFPEITITETGKRFLGNMSVIYLKDLILSINYSLSLE